MILFFEKFFIVDDKDLKNTAEIKRKYELNLAELDKLKEQSTKNLKKFDLEQSALKRQLKAEKQKSLQLSKEIEHYRNVNQDISIKLKQKERALNDRNMYTRSNNLTKSPSKTPSSGKSVANNKKNLSPKVNPNKEMNRVASSNSSVPTKNFSKSQEFC